MSTFICPTVTWQPVRAPPLSLLVMSYFFTLEHVSTSFKIRDAAASSAGDDPFGGSDLGLVFTGSTYLLMATWNPRYSPRYTSEVDVVQKGSLGCSYVSSSGLITRMTSLVMLGLSTVKTHRHGTTKGTQKSFTPSRICCDAGAP